MDIQIKPPVKEQTFMQSNPQKWVADYHEYLLLFALGRVNDRELCQDLVHDTFIAALERLGTFRGACSEKTWLTAILKNKIIDLYRRKQFEQKYMLVFRQSQIVQQGVIEFYLPPSFHDGMELMEMRETIENCMKNLPGLWNSVVRQKYFLDIQPDDICSELNLSKANYWAILHRARLKLKILISKKHGLNSHQQSGVLRLKSANPIVLHHQHLRIALQ